MVTFTYWDISDLGGSATVGAQSEQGAFLIYFVAYSSSSSPLPSLTFPSPSFPLSPLYLLLLFISFVALSRFPLVTSLLIPSCLL